MAIKEIASYLQDGILQQKKLAANLNAQGVIASETEKFNTLVPKVLLIERGEGGVIPPITIGNLRIRYFYRDKVTGREKIHIQNLNAGENGVFPTDAGDVAQTDDNPALIFQGWTRTQAQLNNVQNNIDVRAKYITEDGKTYFRIRITRTTGAGEADALIQPIYLNRTGAGTLSLNLGDGSATEEITTTGNLNITPTYSKIGDYWVTAWISEGTGTFTFGNGTTSTTVFGGNTQSKRNILRNVFIGSNVTSIGEYAFTSCFSLSSITIPDGITSIGASAFNSCYPLSSITIPNSVTSIGNNTFQNCFSLSSITIPDGITSIGSNTFRVCFSLTSITIPDSVTSISTSAFLSCYSLTSITIPDGVTSIGSGAFQECYSLTSITIPDGVTSIGTFAFQNCYLLIEYVFESITPPTLSNINAFTGINSIAKIFVPDESVDAYKAATNWVNFALYIFPMSARGI